jgi:hypothetical protein
VVGNWETNFQAESVCKKQINALQEEIGPESYSESLKEKTDRPVLITKEEMESVAQERARKKKWKKDKTAHNRFSK